VRHSTKANHQALRAIAIRALGTNAGPSNATDVLCGALETLRCDVFVAQSAIGSIASGGIESFEVTLIGLAERIEALRDLAIECMQVEWRGEHGGAS
jgi:hypothetical protein